MLSFYLELSALLRAQQGNKSGCLAALFQKLELNMIAELITVAERNVKDMFCSKIIFHTEKCIMTKKPFGACIFDFILVCSLYPTVLPDLSLPFRLRATELPCLICWNIGSAATHNAPMLKKNLLGLKCFKAWQDITVHHFSNVWKVSRGEFACSCRPNSHSRAVGPPKKRTKLTAAHSHGANAEFLSGTCCGLQWRLFLPIFGL